MLANTKIFGSTGPLSATAAISMRLVPRISSTPRTLSIRPTRSIRTVQYVSDLMSGRNLIPHSRYQTDTTPGSRLSHNGFTPINPRSSLPILCNPHSLRLFSTTSPTRSSQQQPAKATSKDPPSSSSTFVTRMTNTNSPTHLHPEHPPGSWQADWIIIRELMTYVWPQNQPGIKARVVIALSLLVGGKLLNVYVPIFFKHIVDALNNASGSSAVATTIATESLDATVMTIAGALLLGYGAARLGAVLFQELRNAIFGLVAQRAVRDAARGIFSHLHNLDLSFHLDRQTGGLVRAIDRGTKGIQMILSSIVFNVVPTALEISMVCGILAVSFGVEYAVVTIATMLTYGLFTVTTTAWRTKFRRQMNAADNEAASTATDSLINFEA
ncbi:Iron-sulfur clusters transporter atm1, mitochondrial, partial [Blyttiomyces sp. JEL0837]